MRRTLAEYLLDFSGNRDVAFMRSRGLRRVRWTYAQVAEVAFQFARELQSRGINRGDRVIIWGENSPEWVAAFYGCALGGAIVVPLDEQSAPDFAVRVFEQVRPKLILHGARQKNLNATSPTISLEQLSETVAPKDRKPFSPENIQPQDMAEIIFTSGTTARPKGVRLTHENLLSNLGPIEDEAKKYLKWERLVHPIRILSLLPLSHVFGQFMGLLVPPLLRAEVHFLNTLNPSQIIETISRERISVVAAVPRVLEILRNKLERDFETKGELNRFRENIEEAKSWNAARRWWEFRRVHRKFGLKFWAFVVGGATLDAETEKFWRRLGFVVIQGYGMTETAALISLNHPFKSDQGSIGEILPGQEIKLDEGGEILVRGRNVTPGYWDEQRGEREDEWFRTGDVAEMDASGKLYFRGRKKDVIVTSAGLKIHPEDLESALNAQPEIAASAVVGIEGAQGPEPIAALILRDHHVDLAAVVARVNERLAVHQRIRRWILWPEPDFPRTSTQKIRKQSVAEFVRAGMGGNSLRAEAASPIAEMIARVGGEAASVNPSMRLSEDLKLDSLARVELMSAIEERYQVDLDEAAFTEATTVGDVEQMIRQEAEETGLRRFTYPRWAQKFPVTWFRIVFFYAVILPVTIIMSRRRIIGREHLENLVGPVLFISNHVAAADHAVIMSAMPGRFRRRLAIAMDGELLESWLHPRKGTPLFTRARHLAMYVLAVTVFNVFPLPQRSGFRRSFAYAGRAVDRGHNLLVFPEGRRTTNGLIHKFQSGVGILATRLELPVVPIKIEGLYEMKTERRYFARSGEVSVTFGEPVKFGADENPADIAFNLEQRVRRA